MSVTVYALLSFGVKTKFCSTLASSKENENKTSDDMHSNPRALQGAATWRRHWHDVRAIAH